MTQPTSYSGKPRGLKATPTEEDVWTLAVQRARYLFETFDHVAVDFSGGKDSTATLHAVLTAAHEKPEERLPVRVIFWDEEIISPDTEAYVRRVSQRDDVALEWYCIPIRHRNGASKEEPYWAPWAPEDSHKWVRPLPPEAITDIPGYAGIHDPTKRIHHSDLAGYLFDPAIHGEAVHCLGIRAQESLRRYQAVNRRAKDNWIIRESISTARGALYKAYPIYDWQHSDMWTAPATFGWDYNHEYDTLEMAGVTPGSQRVGTPFGNEALGGLHKWQICYPDLWAKMLDRVPGVNTAAMYARTELYGHGGYPQKPANNGQTWMDFIIALLQTHTPENQRLYGQRVLEDLEFHRRETNNAPLAEKAPHPDTGLSWDFLAMLAQRGDTMARKDMRTRRSNTFTKPEQHARKTEKYQAEIAQIKADGRYKEII